MRAKVLGAVATVVMALGCAGGAQAAILGFSLAGTGSGVERHNDSLYFPDGQSNFTGGAATIFDTTFIYNVINDLVIPFNSGGPNTKDADALKFTYSPGGSTLDGSFLISGYNYLGDEASISGDFHYYDLATKLDISTNGTSYEITGGKGELSLSVLSTFYVIDPFPGGLTQHYGVDYASINIDGVVGYIDTSNVSAVPLPASAPLFGAALLALGGVGYASRRAKAKAA